MGRLVGVHELDGIEREGRQRLGQVELCLQVHVDTDQAVQIVGFVEPFHHLGLGQRAVDGDGPADVSAIGGAGLVIVGEQPSHGRAAVAGPVQHVHQHRVRHVELRAQQLRLACRQPLEGACVPWRIAPLGRRRPTHLAELGRVVAELLAGLLERHRVLHLVLGCLAPHKALVVEAAPPGPACDLLEVAHRQHPRVAAVVLAELGEHHRANGHVDAHAERVGAADELEQARAGQPLDQQPVLGQHPGVMHADAGLDEALDVAPERRVEPEVDDLGGHLRFLVLGEHVEAGERLRPLGGGLLGEVDDVGGHPAQLQQLFERLVQRGLAIGEGERHRSFGPGHRGHLAA